MAQMNPSPSKPVVRYPTALLEDKELITIHDSRLPDYKALEYGTPYFDQNKFPGLKLIFQEPLGEDDRMVRRVWAGDRQDQDLYNADRKYSGGSTEHPILVRRYLFPEEGYEPLPTGTPDSQFPEAVLVEEEVAQPENRNGYLAVTRVFETIPGPVLTGKLVTDKGQVATITTQVVAPGTTVTPSALTVSASVKPDSQGKSVLEKVEVGEVFSEARFTAEKPEVVPTQFRAAVPEETSEFVEIGEAEMPVLDQEGDKAASQEQLTKFTKRVRRVRRDLSNVSESLEETNVDEAGIVETITKTLKTGLQTVAPSATVRGQVEELGDGLTLKTEVEKAKIFGGKVLAAERPDPVPEKFRVAVPTKTVEETVTGTATDPVLVGGEIAESEQQVTEFTKRTRKVTRDIPKDNEGKPVSVALSQKATTPEGLLASVTETFQAGDTAITPTAKISVESEAIGDGTYVVRKTELPEVFSGNVFTAERPDPVPEKFRVAVPTVTTESTLEGTAGQPTLVGGEIAESEQQVTKHTKRTRKVSRDITALPKTLTQTATTNEGLKATVTETLQSGDTTETPTATKSVESEAIGDGTYVVRTTTLPEVFDGKTLSAERPDPIPEKFRISIPSNVVEETVVGTVANPTLVGNELAESEQQVTKHTKRTRKVTRDALAFDPLTGKAKELTQRATTNEGIKATVTETLQNADSTETPSAKVSIESEALGDGNYVVRKTALDEVFSAKSLSVENPDPVPQKFRIAVPATTTEETVEGTVSATLTLDTGELSKAEQQATKFTKRTRKTSRATTGLPKTLTQTATTNDGLKATVTETLQSGDTTEVPSATKSIESEAMGDGTYVVRTTVLPEIFDGKTLSSERPDPVPQKFRVSLPVKTEETTLAGTATDLGLGPGEFAASEQQVTKHTKRRRKVRRDTADLPKSLTQLSTNDQQQPVFVTETLQTGDTTRRPSATVAVQSENLGDGTFVVRAEDAVEVLPAPVYSIESSDLTPQKFRNRLPSRTEETTKVGTAGKPELKPGELSKTVQQVDKFRFRSRVTKKPVGLLPTALTQTATNERGQRVAITETLQAGDTGETPTAIKSIESEALGDGNYVVRKTELPEVFSEKSVSAERPENTPQKFRSKLPTTVVEEVVEGEVGDVSLAAGEVAASEQQLTAFTKRTRRASRSLAALPQTLTQTATNERGQKVTITETFQSGDTSASPSATTQVESEAVGDGTYVVRTTSVPEVFAGKRVEQQKDEDSIPARFRAAIERKIIEETQAGTVNEALALSGNQIAASEEQVTAHTKRRRTVERNIGAGSTTLNGQNYDPTLDVVLPYTERIVTSGRELGQKSREVTPLSGDEDLVREFNFDQIKSALQGINLEFPSRASLSLPPVLKSVRLVWDVSQEQGTFSGGGNGSGTGTTWSWDVSVRGEARAVASVMPGWVVDMEEVWASGVPTTSHIFFLPYPVKESDILSKLNVARWPVFRPESHTLVAFGKKVATTSEKSRSRGRSSTSAISSNNAVTVGGTSTSQSQSYGDGTSSSISTTSVTVRIPPCLHRAISINDTKEATASATATATLPEVTGGGGGNAPAQAKARSQASFNLGATQPSDIPRSGRYLIDSRVEPYQYGFARVYAEVLDALVFNSAFLPI